VGCWHGYLSRARCRFANGPADATATHCLLLQEIQIGFGFTFLVLAHPGNPRQRAIKRVYVCLLFTVELCCVCECRTVQSRIVWPHPSPMMLVQQLTRWYTRHCVFTHTLYWSIIILLAMCRQQERHLSCRKPVTVFLEVLFLGTRRTFEWLWFIVL